MLARRSTHRVRAVLAMILTAFPFADAGAQLRLPDSFEDQPVISGLAAPTAMAFLPDGRILVTERYTARIRLVDGSTFGDPDPVATVDSVAIGGGEQGLLGIVIDAAWPDRPYVYVQYTCTDSSIRIARFTASGDLQGIGGRSLTIDPATRYLVLADAPDTRPWHNGGSLHTGPDGMLYSSLGDDGFACAAQNLTILAGKILRLDVSRLPDGPGGPAPRALLTPSDNPFVDHPDSNARLVYAHGLRNPFSFAVDSYTGDLFIADVGWESYEELNWAHGAGMNFGWPIWEGPLRLGSCPGADTSALTPPIAWHPTPPGASIMTAGVYRPPAGAARPFPPEYHGEVFFSDFFQSFVRRMHWNGAAWEAAASAPGQPNPLDWAIGLAPAASLAVGPDGSLHYAQMFPDGQIRRIAWAGAVEAPSGPRRRTAFRPRPVPAMDGVTFELPAEDRGPMLLAIHDATGRLVRRFVVAGGAPTLIWDGRDEDGRRAPPGLYLARLSVRGEALTRRVVTLR